jgi:hypothetical protein
MSIKVDYRIKMCYLCFQSKSSFLKIFDQLASRCCKLLDKYLPFIKKTKTGRKYLAATRCYNWTSNLCINQSFIYDMLRRYESHPLVHMWMKLDPILMDV